jgi:peroxiredoxin
VGLGVLAIVVGMLYFGRSVSTTKTTGIGTEAPAFTLSSTDGRSVSLSDYGGRDVLLYFNEGVGCDACFYQMAELEKSGRQLAAKGLTVLPIVVNPAGDVRQEIARFGLRTPFLIDADQRVSNAYGVVGTGMHANLPGHSFVLVDGSGRIRWRGDFPSMFVSTNQLLADMGFTS